MDKQKEWNRLDEATMCLCEYLARMRAPSMPKKMFENIAEYELSPEGRVYVERCALQVEQLIVLRGFIMKAADSYFKLLEEPEQAREIGEEGLGALFAFLEEYIELLAEERG